MKINRKPLMPIQPVDEVRSPARKGSVSKKGAPDFAQVLDRALEKRPVKMSAHAQMRLRDRNIAWTDQDHERMKDTFDALEDKGARKSVVFYKESAFVASVSNRTVITAMGLDEDLQVITNIDSAAHVK